MDSDIKIRHGKFQGNLFDKRDLFRFSLFGMPGKSINVPYNIIYSEIGAESLRNVRASNNPPLREKCPNTEIFLVRISLHSD